MSQILKEAFGIAVACGSHTEVAFLGSEMAICSSCGGSGFKRMSEQRFRTCHDCLGRGVLQTVSSPTTSTFAERSVVESLEERAEKFKEVGPKTVGLKTAVTSASAK